MNFLKRKFLWAISHHLTTRFDKQTVLLGRQMAEINNAKLSVADLSEFEFSVFSQFGEDGIIHWLTSKIMDLPKVFIEFGVGDYTEANTRFLMVTKNWRGLVIDGSMENMDRVRQQDIYWRHALKAVSHFIDKDNINSLFLDNGISGEIGLLSIDIDGNDYWVWEAIHSVNPAIIVCEYNAVFGDINKVSVPYDPAFQRTKAHHSNLYFGASLPALASLAKSKGYEFVGTTSNGLNAFFVRQDKMHFVQPYLQEMRSYPSVFREARDAEGKLTFPANNERIGLIEHLPVFDFDAGEEKYLNQFQNIYSPNWR